MPESKALPLALPSPWLHVVVDMQRVFAEPGEWHAPALAQVVEPIARLCATSREATAFTRFVTVRRPADARGMWRAYYDRWASVRLDTMDAAMLDIIEALRPAARAGSTHDKTTHSAFASGGFADWLSRTGYATLVLSGVETDVCVLGTALDAVDRGLGVVVVRDAVASSSAAGHAATLNHVLPRFDQQLAVADATQIVAEWPRQ